MKKKIHTSLGLVFPFLNIERNRQNWVKSKMLKIPEGQSILDAGAGETQYKKFCFKLKYTAQDFGGYDGKGDGVGNQTSAWDNSRLDIVSDIISIPVENASFDNILCTEVLEHIPCPDKAIAEFSRILKPGGTLYLTAPFASYTHFSPYHFCTGFNRYWYEEILSRDGFNIVSIEASGNFFDVLCQELARSPFVLAKHSRLSYLSYLLFIIVVPVVCILMLCAKLTTKSETLSCFGYHVVAKKLK